jgi:hypothetical protein
MAFFISQLPTVMISRHDSSILENMTYIPGTFLRARIYAREHPSFDPASAILVAIGASTAMLAAWLSAGSERKVVCGGKLKTSNNPDSTAAGVEGELCIQTADCLDLVPAQERRPSDRRSISRKPFHRSCSKYWRPTRSPLCRRQLLLSRPAILLHPRCHHVCHCPLLLCGILGHDIHPLTGR